LWFSRNKRHIKLPCSTMPRLCLTGDRHPSNPPCTSTIFILVPIFWLRTAESEVGAQQGNIFYTSEPLARKCL
jgi:hypothetical protein